MSVFSGKYDFFDLIKFLGIDTVLRSDIFTQKDDGELTKLNVQRKKDLINLFPHAVIYATWKKDEDKADIVLSLYSHMQMEEEMYRPIDFPDHEAYKEAIRRALAYPDTVKWNLIGGKHESKGKEQGTKKTKKAKKNGSMVGSKRK